MASGGVLILSSSPPRSFATYNMPSSSPLPSLSELAQNKPQIIRTGSRAALIPQNASASLTSAAPLLKAASPRDWLGGDAIGSFRMDTGDDGTTAKDLPKFPTAKPRKPATKRVEGTAEKLVKAPLKTATKKNAVDVETQPKKPRKPRVKVADQDLGDGQMAKEPAPRKPRTKKTDKESDDKASKPNWKAKIKKSDGESQMKLSKGHVTKSSSKSTSEKADKLLKSKKSESALAESVDAFPNSLGYGLIEAVKRRTDWTPPMPTRKVADITPASANQLECDVTSGGSLQPGERTKGFKDLFGSFGFTKLDSNAVGKKPLEAGGPRKRKLIELVKTGVSAAAAASPKEKATKKKARTITDQATSAYAEGEELPTAPAPLLQYFSYQITEPVKNDGFKVPPKPRSKSPVKGPSKAKKGSAQAPILLSPESALKHSSDQDFVFGTSSQLAREDSPTLLRDLHEAMRASNKVDEDDPFTDSTDESAQAAFAHRWGIVPSTKRNLWSAAARNCAAELLEIEMVDLINSPVITRNPKATVVPEATGRLGNQEDDDVWHDIEGMNEELTQTDLTSGNIQRTISLVEEPGALKEPKTGMLSRVANDLSLEEHQSARKNRPSRSPSKAAKAAKPTDLQKPDLSSYTNAQLAKEIASYRFKPVKNRDQMITLLERCWEGKNRIALGALGTNVVSTAPLESSKSAAPVSSQMNASLPKRPRGRPRKGSETFLPPKLVSEAKLGRPKAKNIVEYLEMDSDTPLSQIRTPKKSKKKAKEPAEDISDSDTQATPSPRRNASQVRTPPLPLKLSTSVDVDTSPELYPASSQRLLFMHITRAVRNAPPSKDPSMPSWHEKILLYDPIILEDLTVWLNTGALEKVGWDGEVEPKELKKWCESKSICCLWRENLRGGARSHY